MSTSLFVWQTPPSFSPAEVLAAAELNTISNDLNYLKSRLDAGGGTGGSVEHKTSGGTGSVSATLAGVFVVCGFVTFAAASGFCSYTGSGGGSQLWHESKSLNSSNPIGSAGAGTVRVSAGGSMSASSSGGTVTSGRLSAARIGA